jgi:saxitoxin biosynthesis operon SxtJ-like protein
VAAPNPERSFGLSVGGVLCALAAFFFWRGSTLRSEVLAGIGAFLVVFGFVYPRLLKWPSAVWWRFAHALGYVNARIILTILFGLILVPLGLVWRFIGRDPLGRRRDKWPGWSPYPERYRDRSHYARMF